MFDPTFSSTTVLPNSKPSSLHITGKVSNVPTDIISYLSQLSKELENANRDETSMITDKAYNELYISYTKHLVGICGHYEGSRKLEHMLSCSRTFVIQFGMLVLDCFVEADIISLVRDKIGSHVLQSFIINSRPLLKENNDTCLKLVNSIEYVSSIFIPSTFSLVSQEELITDMHASHVLRSILVTLSGKPIYYEHVFSIQAASTKSSPLETMGIDCDHSVYLFFERFILKFLSSIEIDNTEKLIKLSNSQYASPIIQMILIMERAFSYKLVPKNLSILEIIMNIAKNPEIASTCLKSLCFGKVSSRIIESFIYACKKSMLKAFLDKFLIFNTKSMLKDDTGNFILQAFFTWSSSKSSSIKLFNELSSLTSLKGLNPKRIGLLYKTIISEHIPRSSTHQYLLLSLQKSFMDNDDGNIALSLITPSPSLSKSHNQNRHKEFHPIGCAILTHLVSSCQTPDIKIILDQFLVLPYDVVYRMGMDSSGSRTLEGIFESSFIDQQIKIRLFKKLLAASLLESNSLTILTLACDTYGSRVVEKMFLALSIEYKTALTEYLSGYIKDLKYSSKGQYVFKKCMLDEFILSKSNWVSLIANKEKKEKAISILLDGKQAKKLVKII